MQAEEERNEILDEEYLSPMHFFLKKRQVQLIGYLVTWTKGRKAFLI